MGYDIFRHQESFNAWKSDATDSNGNINLKYIEESLTKENTKLFLQYILDMEQGANVSNKSIKGARSPKTLNRLRSKLKSIMVGLQNRGFNDISKITPKEINIYFKEWVESGHTNDYAKRFRSFWNWWMKKNRREGKVVNDVAEDLSTANKSTSDFVWITKDELDKIQKYFSEEKQLCLMFTFDSLVRAPSELFGLKVENVYQKPNGEVWINIPDSISKTYGRQFNLLYCGEELMRYIKERSPEEQIFKFSYVNFTKELQAVAEQVFRKEKSQGGKYFKDITLYSLRHSGAIHLRQIFQKTGQSLDSLRHRGGWADFRIINYYTKFLGLDGHISKEKILLEEDKTKIEKEMERMKEAFERALEERKRYDKLLNKIVATPKLMAMIGK